LRAKEAIGRREKERGKNEEEEKRDIASERETEKEREAEGGRQRFKKWYFKVENVSDTCLIAKGKERNVRNIDWKYKSTH